MRCWQAIFHLTGNWSVSRNIRDLGVHDKSLCGLETLMSNVLGLRISFLCGQGASHCDTQAEICMSIKWLIYVGSLHEKRISIFSLPGKWRRSRENVEVHFVAPKSWQQHVSQMTSSSRLVLCRCCFCMILSQFVFGGVGSCEKWWHWCCEPS